MTGREGPDGLVLVALVSTGALALLDLHREALAAVIAWSAAWWLLRRRAPGH